MLKNSFENAKDSYKGIKRALVRFRIRGYKPKIIIDEQIGSYQIKTAESEEELYEVLKLRAEVFFEEKGFSGGESYGLDFDKYDLKGDHIILIDLKNKRSIATYRVLSDVYSDDFYSETEFILDDFVNEESCKLELGRACIAKDYRNGTSLNLIWKGIGFYIRAIGADYVFGCTSIPSKNRMLAERLTAHFYNEKIISNEFNIEPNKKHRFKFKDYQPIPADLRVQEFVPALMQSYIKAGAKVVASPALDRNFGCFDFLTILKISEMNEKYLKRYILGGK